MRCKIEGCNHTKSVRMWHTGGTCWDLWQICPCCANELGEMESIEFEYVNAHRCMNIIKVELLN